jgi:5'-3' exonuclease
MKPLVLVDFSHLFSRNIFVAINQANPSKKGGKYITEEFTPQFRHLIFNSLQYIKNMFKGEVLLALDSQGNWRKDFYEDYKGTRAKGKEEGDLNWDEVYPVIDEIVEVIRNYFPFKVLKVPKAEADDIGGVLSTVLGNERNVILVTSDHDWLQNITHGQYVQMYDPMKQKYVDLSDFEHEIIDTPVGKMSRFTAMHSLQGDSGDNVPKLTFQTEFSPNFLTYLKENEIYSESVKEVRSLDIFPELVEKYDTYSTVKSGKRKGEVKYDYRIWYRLSTGSLIKKDEYIKKGMSEEFTVEEVPEKDIYKSVNFGGKKLTASVQTSETLTEVLNSHELYMDNFKFSNTLVDFDKIPEELKKNIIESYNECKINYDPSGILNYFIDEGLGKHVSQISKFHDRSCENMSSSSLDDFF